MQVANIGEGGGGRPIFIRCRWSAIDDGGQWSSHRSSVVAICRCLSSITVVGCGYGCQSVLFVVSYCWSIVIIIGYGRRCGIKKVWSANSCDQPECRFSKYESLERIAYQDLGRMISKAWPGDNERHPSVLSKQWRDGHVRGCGMMQDPLSQSHDKAKLRAFPQCQVISCLAFASQALNLLVLLSITSPQIAIILYLTPKYQYPTATRTNASSACFAGHGLDQIRNEAWSVWSFGCA